MVAWGTMCLAAYVALEQSALKVQSWSFEPKHGRSRWSHEYIKLVEMLQDSFFL